MTDDRMNFISDLASDPGGRVPAAGACVFQVKPVARAFQAAVSLSSAGGTPSASYLRPCAPPRPRPPLPPEPTISCSGEGPGNSCL